MNFLDKSADEFQAQFEKVEEYYYVLHSDQKKRAILYQEPSTVLLKDMYNEIYGNTTLSAYLYKESQFHKNPEETYNSSLSTFLKSISDSDT